MCAPVSGKGGSSKDENNNFHSPVDKEELSPKYDVELKGDREFFELAKENAKEQDKESTTFALMGTYAEEEPPPEDYDWSDSEGGVDLDVDTDGDPSGDGDGDRSDDVSSEATEDDEDDNNDGIPDGEDRDENDDGDSRASESESGEPRADGDDSKTDGKIISTDEKTEMNGKDVKPTEKFGPKDFISEHYKSGKLTFSGLASGLNNPYLMKNQPAFRLSGLLSLGNYAMKDFREQVKENPVSFSGLLSPLSLNFKDIRLAFREKFSISEVDSKHKVTEQFVEKAKEAISTMKETIAKQEDPAKKSFEQISEEKEKKSEEIGKTYAEINKLYEEKKQKEEEIFKSDEWIKLKQEEKDLNDRYDMAVESLASRGISEFSKEGREELSPIKGLQADAKEDRDNFRKEHLGPIEERIDALQKQADTSIQEKRDLSAELHAMKKEGKPDDVEQLKARVETLSAIVERLESDPTAHVNYKEMGELYDAMLGSKCIDFDKKDNFAAMFEGGADYICASYQELRDSHEYERTSLHDAIDNFNSKFGHKIDTDNVDALRAFADHTKLGVDGNDLRTTLSTAMDVDIAKGTFFEIKGVADELKEFNDAFKDLARDYHCTKPDTNNSNNNNNNADNSGIDIATQQAQTDMNNHLQQPMPFPG